MPGKLHFIAVVATDGDEVVGGLAAYELDKFEQYRRDIYIYDLAVAEHQRRWASPEAELTKIAAAAPDAYVILVQAVLEDGPAIAIYGSLGPKKIAHHFDIALPAGDRRHRRTDHEG